MLAHYLLGHNIGNNDGGAGPRYTVYYRLHADGHRLHELFELLDRRRWCPDEAQRAGVGVAHVHAVERQDVPVNVDVDRRANAAVP